MRRTKKFLLWMIAGSVVVGGAAKIYLSKTEAVDNVTPIK